MEFECTHDEIKDIDIGRFQCTQCGEVMYYTGAWQKFHEEGTPCLGSDMPELFKENNRTRKVRYDL